MSGAFISRARCAIPRGLLGMLALVGLIERSWIQGNLAISNSLGDCWRQTARQLEKAARGRDVLCFGDSMVKNGLNPHVIQARAGRSTFNLAVIGGSSPSSYF